MPARPRTSVTPSTEFILGHIDQHFITIYEVLHEHSAPQAMHWLEGIDNGEYEID